MRNEPVQISLQRRTRRAPGTQCHTPSAAATSKLQVVDAAFADLKTINLRRDKPLSTVADNVIPLPYQGIVQELASQLQALEQQRRHLTQLMNDLQTPISTAV